MNHIIKSVNAYKEGGKRGTRNQISRAASDLKLSIFTVNTARLKGRN